MMRRRRRRMKIRVGKILMNKFFLISEKNGKVIEKQVEEEDESDKAGQIWRKGKKFIFCLGFKFYLI